LRDNVTRKRARRQNVKVQLSVEEARVVGALIEKEITTPDQYPLSLNSLTNACNQKSNRDPVMQLDERRVQQLLDGLSRRALAVDRSGFGSRVPKYRHLFCNTAFGSLKFSPQELAIICELLLRGPQTPGELRGRASRMCPFRDVGEVEAILEQLSSREDGPFVARLAREPGRRESRYAQLFTGTPVAGPTESTPAVTAPVAQAIAPDDRLELLERSVERLEMEVAELKRKLGE
jgi:uncharacterized protein YceH (UPF0502 family)